MLERDPTDRTQDRRIQQSCEQRRRGCTIPRRAKELALAGAGRPTGIAWSSKRTIFVAERGAVDRPLARDGERLPDRAMDRNPERATGAGRAARAQTSAAVEVRRMSFLPTSQLIADPALPALGCRLLTDLGSADAMCAAVLQQASSVIPEAAHE